MNQALIGFRYKSFVAIDGKLYYGLAIRVWFIRQTRAILMGGDKKEHAQEDSRYVESIIRSMSDVTILHYV